MAKRLQVLSPQYKTIKVYLFTKIKIIKHKLSEIQEHSWDFPCGPVDKTLPSNAGVVGSIHGQAAKIPHAFWPKNQNIKQKQHCNKFNKDFRKGWH